MLVRLGFLGRLAKALSLIALLLIATPAMVEEFSPFDNSAIRNRHLTSPLMSYGIAMTAHHHGMKSEYAAVLGFGVTALTEHIMHKGRHGLTKSELIMIGTGSVFFYLTNGFLTRGFYGTSGSKP